MAVVVNAPAVFRGSRRVAPERHLEAAALLGADVARRGRRRRRRAARAAGHRAHARGRRCRTALGGVGYTARGRRRPSSRAPSRSSACSRTRRCDDRRASCSPHCSPMPLLVTMPSERPDDRRLPATSCPITTRWMDNDVYGHINNVTYYSYFDTVANQLPHRRRRPGHPHGARHRPGRRVAVQLPRAARVPASRCAPACASTSSATAP